jgi:phosphocarrier protein HPr
MVRRDLMIVNKLGLHARAAAKLVTTATRYGSLIEVERRGQRVNCKSIMGIMMLAASCGSSILVEASGPDEAEAMAAIEDLIANRFGEEE